MNEEEAKEILRETMEYSASTLHSVWSDFVRIGHNVSMNLEESGAVDFDNYGYIEMVQFGKCLSLFEDRGYDQVTKLIDEVVKEGE